MNSPLERNRREVFGIALKVCDCVCASLSHLVRSLLLFITGRMRGLEIDVDVQIDATEMAEGVYEVPPDARALLAVLGIRIGFIRIISSVDCAA